MDNSVINIVLTGDQNYIVPFGVVITSVMRNLPEKRYARFFLFTDNFTQKDIARIKECERLFPHCSIENIPMDTYRSYFTPLGTEHFASKYISLACYYRLLMFSILSEDVKKCFYIDGDMIVDTDLSLPYDAMPEDALACVVVETWAMQKRETVLAHCYHLSAFEKFRKNPLGHPYFNAGFYLLNTGLAKKLNLFERALDFLKENKVPYADQDALNAVMGQSHSDLLVYLPPEYNVFCNLDYTTQFDDAYYAPGDIARSLQNPKIYHYAGLHKPWQSRAVQHYYDVWWKYCKLSPFSSIKQPKLTYLLFDRSALKQKLKARLFRHKRLLGVLRFGWRFLRGIKRVLLPARTAK